MKKTRFWVLLSVCITLLLLLLSVSVGAISGKTGSCIWTYEGTKLIINGSGPMDFLDSSAWSKTVTEVEVREGVTSVPDVAFYNCPSLRRVTLSSTVKEIGRSAFSECTSLQEIVVAKTSKHFMSDNGILFSKDKSVLIRYPSANSSYREYTVPDSVRSISIDAFENNWYLSRVRIPDTVKHIGLNAFDGSMGLATVENGVFYIDNHVIDVVYGDTTWYEIRKGTKTIAEGAFGGSRCEVVMIPEGVVTIESNAFTFCDGLEWICLPKSLDFIGESAFYGCKSLEEVSYGGNTENLVVMDIGDYNDDLLDCNWSYDTCMGREEHEWSDTIILKEATCEGEGVGKWVCEHCGLEEVEEFRAKGHTPLDAWSQTVEPSCMAAGEAESFCLVCGKLIKKRLEPREHIFSAWRVTESPTCTEQGLKKRTCALCEWVDAVHIEPNGHEMTQQVEQPTIFKDGKEISTCEICGAVDTVVLPRKDLSVGFVLLLVGGGVIVLSVVGLTAILLVSRQKKKKENS